MSTPAPSPATFHPFGRMPQELCDMVWDTALIDEAKNRMVFVDGETRAIYPTKLLVSRISRSCSASRERAKSIYSCKEAVYEVECRDMFLGDEDGQEFLVFRLGREVGAVYLSPRYDIFCPGFYWPPVGPGRTYPCMRNVSYFSTKSLTSEHPLLQSVRNVCLFVGYQLGGRGNRFFKGFTTGEFPTRYDLDHFEIQMFPNAQHWIAVFYPDQYDMDLPIEIEASVLTTDVQVIADKGWEGQRQLMNLLPFKYQIASIGPEPEPKATSILWQPLPDLNEIINDDFVMPPDAQPL